MFSCDFLDGDSMAELFCVILSLTLTTLLGISSASQRLFHQDAMLQRSAKTDPKVKSYIVGQMSRDAALFTTWLFQVFWFCDYYVDSTSGFAYLLYICFALHSWFIAYVIYFKFDLVKFETIKRGSFAWCVVILHRLNLILTVVDTALLRISDRGRSFEFVPALHVLSSYIFQLVMVCNTILLLREYKILYMRHVSRRNLYNIAVMWNRNRLWLLMFNANHILNWTSFTYCTNPPLYLNCLFLFTSSLTIIFTYKNWLIFLCPFCFTVSRTELLPEDRKSITCQTRGPKRTLQEKLSLALQNSNHNLNGLNQKSSEIQLQTFPDSTNNDKNDAAFLTKVARLSVCLEINAEVNALPMTRPSIFNSTRPSMFNTAAIRNSIFNRKLPSPQSKTASPTLTESTKELRISNSVSNSLPSSRRLVTPETLNQQLCRDNSKKRSPI